MDMYSLAHDLQKQIEAIPLQDLGYETIESRQSRSEQIHQLLQKQTEKLSLALQDRLREEFTGAGPLAELFADENICEILVLSKDEIWFEKNGDLHRHPDTFTSLLTFQNFVHRLCQELGKELTKDRPTIDGQLRQFRIHIIDSELTQSSVQISFRRQNTVAWTFSALADLGWAEPEQISIIRSWITERKNFLVVGPTGSGKTSVLNACLQELKFNERIVVIEDTKEVHLSNSVSSRLLARQDSHGGLKEISMSDLLKQSLRMRPDRLVIGEVRGGEAKDLLLALSTGHGGSMGTLHASNPHQALIRLEMLIQMGAPHWSLSAIRKLISVSLDGIIIVGKDHEGKRKLLGLYALTSLEDTGFLTEKII